MEESRSVTPEAVKGLLEWAGLTSELERVEELATLCQTFRGHLQRLYDVDVEGVEFDFLHPLES